MKIAILGASGLLGTDLVQILSKDHSVLPFSSETIQLHDQDQLNNVLEETFPIDLIINAAAMTDVDGAESDQDTASKSNHLGAKHLALFCKAHRIPLIHFSTDYVFDGTATDAYQEADTTNPLNYYGKTKLNGEQAIQGTCSDFLIFRLQSLFGSHGKNFITTILNLAEKKESLSVISDQWMSPTYSKDVASMISALTNHISRNSHKPFGDVPSGIYHYSSMGFTNWANVARFILATQTQLNTDALPIVQNIPSSQYPQAAKRPAFSVLNCDKFDHLRLHKRPSWETAIRSFLEDLSPLKDNDVI